MKEGHLAKIEIGTVGIIKTDENWDDLSPDLKANVSKELWVKLSQKDKEVLSKLTHPDGISESLWDKLDDDTKLSIKKSSGPLTGIYVKPRTWKERWKDKWNRSTLKKYVTGDGIEKECVDDAINMFSLINALGLTLPVTVIASLGYSFWNWLQDTAKANCPEKDIFGALYWDFVLRFTVVIACFCASLCIGLLYFFLRPHDDPRTHDDEFKRWWLAGGRYSLLMLVLLTVASSVTIFMTLNYMVKYISLIINFNYKYTISNTLTT
jgi:hypothetical protein